MAALAEEGEKLTPSRHEQAGRRREAEHSRLAEQHQKQAEAERREASRQRERAEQHLYIARIGQADERPPPVRLRHGPRPAGPVPPGAWRAGPPRLGVVLPRPVVPPRAEDHRPAHRRPVALPSP